MKKSITKFVLAAAVLFGATPAVYAQDPSDSGTKIFCSGSDLTLPAPTGTKTYTVHYDTDSDFSGSSPVTLTGGNTIAAANLETGYYFVMEQEAGGCISEPSDAIPVYVLKPLTAAISSPDYCIEQANTADANFTATPTTTEAGVTTFAYQWYTVSGGTATEIAGATSPTYTPTNNTSNSTTTYRVRVGYLIGTTKYCGTDAEDDVTVTPAPTAPIITVNGATGETW